MEQISSNERMMQAFNNGDVTAFNALYRQFNRPLFYFARKLVPDQEAEDIISICFVKLWNKRADFSTVYNVKAFLFIATRNACFNSLRTSQQLSNSQRELHYLMEDSEEVFHHEITTELMQLIHRDIADLAPQRKKILQLFLAGWSEREIAGKLQITPKTVRNQKANAIQILRNRLVNKASYFLTGTVVFLLQNLF